jgi:hypothetical protein
MEAALRSMLQRDPWKCCKHPLGHWSRPSFHGTRKRFQDASNACPHARKRGKILLLPQSPFANLYL